MRSLGRALIVLSLCSLGAGLRAAEFPVDKLPPYVRKLTDVGERADFSHDGRRILYVTKSGGEVEEIEIATGEVRRISAFAHPPEVGFYRALYLANGDYFLAGGTGRRECVMYFLDRRLDRPPTIIERPIWEGPAISRKRLRMAWTPDHQRLLVADIKYVRGVPTLVNERQVLDEPQVASFEDTGPKGTLEPQNFVPPRELLLTFSQYNETERFTSEVFTLDLASGKLVNHSHAPGQYDEPEGIFPDGRHTLVESDAHDRRGTGFIDLYRLRLDGTGRDFVRLTHFADVPGFRASNPVVSDDGRFIAFQEARTGENAGVGHGIYLLDWKAARAVGAGAASSKRGRAP